MADLKPPRPVGLLVGVIFSDEGLLPPLEAELEWQLGPIELRSPCFDFEITDYYRDEMGADLKRVFYSFKNLISPDIIADIKLTTVEIEALFTSGGKRRVNLDPGYIDYYKLVLASAKFQGQKISVGKGVYVDPTLYYDRGWKPYDWGFPDFKGGKYDDFLTDVRTRYKQKIRQLGDSGATGGGHGRGAR
jgi:hypothetical protein